MTSTRNTGDDAQPYGQRAGADAWRGPEPHTGDPEFMPDVQGLEAALRLLLAHLTGQPQAPVPRTTSEGSAAELPAELPADGMGSLRALERLAPSVLGGAARLGHPGAFAHMDPPTPWLTWAAAQWAAALNQNLLHPDTAPAARELESRVVSWLAPWFGMRGGHLLPGSSLANLTALWAARELRAIHTVVASEAAHLSVRKAAHLLGLAYRTVSVDAHQRLRTDRLGDLSQAALVLTAGTAAVGALDPLDAGSGAAWRHIDAAWAGPLQLSQRHRGLLDGIAEADSVNFSAHKWLWQPKECAAILFADPEAAHAALTFGGAYLAAPNVGLLGSHGAAALPLAATLMAWGRTGIARRLDHCMELADALAGRVAVTPELELWGQPATGVVVWRPRGRDPYAVRDGLDQAFVSVTEVAGQAWLRSVAVNPDADPQLVVDEVLAAAGGSHSAARPEGTHTA